MTAKQRSSTHQPKPRFKNNGFRFKTKLPIKQLRHQLLLLGILLIAAVFRLTGLNWDNHHHLHPDERFLTMVANDSRLPANFRQYLDPEKSPLNPANNNYGFFVYGHFPLIVNKTVAVWLNNDTYNLLVIQGRLLAALADILTVLVVYKIAALIQSKLNQEKSSKKTGKFFVSPNFKYHSALIYALLVLPIQHSHFFTVDIFLTFFTSLSFLLALSYQLKPHVLKLLTAAISFSLALACKITAVLALPPILWLLLNTDNQLQQLIMFGKISINKNLRTANKVAAKSLTKLAAKLGIKLALFFLFTYPTLRLADPYLFANTNWLNPSINPQYIENLEELKQWEGADVWFPPAIQWIQTKPVIFAGKNLITYGMGLAAGGLMIVGLIWSLFKLVVAWKKHRFSFEVISRSWLVNVGLVLLWILAYFGYQSVQFVKTLRYFLPLYPFFSLLAAFGFSQILATVKNHWPRLHLPSTVAGVIMLLIWPLMFLSIYLHPHPRVQASNWLLDNLPTNSLILTEHWDDGLPLGYYPKFRVEQLPVFNQDTPQKWSQINQLLSRADYYVLSSNRGWGSIIQVPKKYPQMSKFYQQLLSEETDFKLLAEFHSYPSLEYLGIPISWPDQSAEEAFTVYDHPRVLIYQRR